MKIARNFAVVAARSVIVTAALTFLPGAPARAATCSREQLQAAVDRAGDQLRQLTAATEPALDARMQRLQKAHGWSDAEVQEKGYGALADERTAELDSIANELLAKIDQLGSDDNTGAPPDCARIAEVQEASLELQSTIKAKAEYATTRLDHLIAQSQAPTAAQPPAPAVAQATSTPTPPPPATPHAAATPPAKPAPPAQPAPPPAWATQTQTTLPPSSLPKPSVPQPAPPVQMATQTPPPPPPASVDQSVEGFSIDEIVDAARGPFGKVSANLARVLEHAFATSGRPTGYILGQETGGAFVAGLRYGEGTLYMRDGRSVPVYWHGPSLGADIGAQGSATLFLVYKIREPDQVFASFTGIEGSAYVVGGIGLTLVSNGHLNLAPIHSGVGLRLGANFGYLRFTPKPTWNPF